MPAMFLRLAPPRRVRWGDPSPGATPGGARERALGGPAAAPRRAFPLSGLLSEEMINIRSD